MTAILVTTYQVRYWPITTETSPGIRQRSDELRTSPPKSEGRNVATGGASSVVSAGHGSPHQTVIELATTEADRALLRFYAVKFNMARPLVAPPDVPAERVAALRAAFDAAMRDPQHLDEARRIGLEVNPLDGAGIAKLIRQVQATPQDVVERLRDLLASARTR